jgi:hypothetical protein
MPSKRGYTIATKIAAANAWVQNFARSAIPPEMMAGTAAAKVSKKKK